MPFFHAPKSVKFGCKFAKKLHIYISDQFREATPQKIMERIPVIRDAAFLDYLKSLGREEE